MTCRLQFTQGEWKQVGTSGFIDSNGYKLALVLPDENKDIQSAYAERQENVRLVSAAPDMYLALKLLLERFEGMEGKYNYPMSLDLPRVFAERVVTKVEGRTLGPNRV